MKKLIAISLFFLLSCSNDYNYRVYGYVNTEKGLMSAEWYVDTLFYDADTIFYINSDGSIVRIYHPYFVEQLK